MDITLYEVGTSRSLRCRWTLKELGLDYQSIEDRSLLRSDELKQFHPLGKMPVALIDGRPLFESSAIRGAAAVYVPVHGTAGRHERLKFFRDERADLPIVLRCQGRQTLQMHTLLA